VSWYDKTSLAVKYFNGGKLVRMHGEADTGESKSNPGKKKKLVKKNRAQKLASTGGAGEGKEKN